MIAPAIAAEVAAKHGLTVAQLRERTSRRVRSWPRQEAMAKCYDAGLTNMQVAMWFGLKNHTTTIHARKRWAERSGPA